MFSGVSNVPLQARTVVLRTSSVGLIDRRERGACALSWCTVDRGLVWRYGADLGRYLLRDGRCVKTIAPYLILVVLSYARVRVCVCDMLFVEMRSVIDIDVIREAVALISFLAVGGER